MESVLKLVTQGAAAILFCIGISSFLFMSERLDRLCSVTKETIVIKNIMYEVQSDGSL